MIAVIQRVSNSQVSIDGVLKSKIGKGLMILLGIEEADNAEDIEKYILSLEERVCEIDRTRQSLLNQFNKKFNRNHKIFLPKAVKKVAKKVIKKSKPSVIKKAKTKSKIKSRRK